MPFAQKVSQQQNQEFEEIALRDTTRRLSRASEEEQAAIRAAGLGLPYLDLNIFPVGTETLSILPEEVARYGKLTVIQKSGRDIKVGVLNPNDTATTEVIEKLEEEEGYRCKIYVVSRTSLERTWERYKQFSLSSSLEDMMLTLSGKDLEKFEKDIKELMDLKKRIRELPTTEVLNVIIAGAIKLDASDIHTEPQKDDVRIRYRLDGVLHDIVHIPYNFYPYVISRVKMLSGLKLNIRDRSQDGRFTIKTSTSEIDVRVSVLPGNYGENVVMRLLNQDAVGLKLEELGLRGRPFEQLITQLSKPNGMILNTGPTGSGKTTTLYAAILRVNTPDTKIITIEDPIEYRLAGVAQTQVHKEKGYDFANGLRAIVRQDPDVILVGEIRDEETGDIAVHASLTGHLVLSTLHTNSAAGAIPRLVDLGIRPTLITPAINAVIAQRLVRVLCPYCKEEYVPAKETLESMGRFLSIISPKAGVEVPKNINTLFRPKGCPKCKGLGYKGRIGIFEIFEINKDTEKLVLDMAPASDLLTAAMESGMITMLQDGILKAVEGTTSMEEVERTTGTGQYLQEIYEKIMVQLLSLQLKVNTNQIKEVLDCGYDPAKMAAIIQKANNKEILAYVAAGGLSFDAGDIHMEPQGDIIKIRYRIDGILQDITQIKAKDYLPILAQIKLLSGLKTDSHEAVQDSRFGINLEQTIRDIPNKNIDVRVSIITGGYGETVVMRLLHKAAQALETEKIGFRPQLMERLLREIEKPNGLILNTGPTGSGKTTTLYSLLNRLNKPEVKIITVEDPIEYRLAGILQTQVSEEEGYDFASALRALLRQNPDIMMIGEIRDEETGKIAIQASLTGHLVLSTLHTNSAVASIQRLINMNIDPTDIATATNAMMAQRLVRRLCPECKKKVPATPKDKEKLESVLKTIQPATGFKDPGPVEFVYEPVGCEKCKNIGFKGRFPVAEIMAMTPTLEEMVSRFMITSEIEKKAMEEGMLTMTQDAALYIAAGETSLAEAARVTEL
jgi:type II secretory ATPase GspE/PulE/Tfp pilus assembly ATPase PilB-like protein